MKITISERATADLFKGASFYNEQKLGLGTYFLDSLRSDIDSLIIYAGIHQKVYGHYRMLSKRFPFAIYYVIEGEEVTVSAVLDCRGSEHTLKKRLAH